MLFCQGLSFFLFLTCLVHFGQGVDVCTSEGGADEVSYKLYSSASEGPAIGGIALPSAVIRAVGTGDEHILVVVEKLKARGTETDALD